MPYFDPSWVAQTWRVVAPIFDAPDESVQGLLRGYMDADGFVHMSNTKGVRVESVNEKGIGDIGLLFDKL